MKLNINKACDLSSISVLPPHSSRRSNPVSSLVDSSGLGQMRMHHMRSQSQQPFLQGMSLSQLSQGSLDEVLTNEQDQINLVDLQCSCPVAGIWQKVIVQDGHMQLMLKREDIKASVSETLKYIPDQLRKEAVPTEQQKSCKIAAAVSSLPTRIEACLLRFQNEICGAFSKEMEADDLELNTGSDEEIDRGFSCLLKKKEAGWKSHLAEEAERESIRILRRARKKRKFDNTILLD